MSIKASRIALPSISDVRDAVHKRLTLAQTAAESMQLSANRSDAEQYAKSAEIVHEIESFRKLDLGFGKKVFAGILFADLRQSSRRAADLPEKDTYLTMHGLLHGLSFVATRFGGYIVGFRGDGLFTAFGIDELGEEVPDDDLKDSIHNSVKCGKAMLEAVEHAIEPELCEFHCEGGLRIGVGIDANPVVITKIGLHRAFEITAYGSAVNKAAKLADITHSKVMITKGAWDMLPTSDGGKWRILTHQGGTNAYRVDFPDSYSALG